MKLSALISAVAMVAMSACTTQPVGWTPQFDATNTIVLRAGQSVILARGQTAKVPYGTVVHMVNGASVTINGHTNTIAAGGGVIVSVPVDAVGDADNLVLTESAPGKMPKPSSAPKPSSLTPRAEPRVAPASDAAHL